MEEERHCSRCGISIPNGQLCSDCFHYIDGIERAKRGDDNLIAEI